MAHDVIFYENRRTPEVVAKGAKGKKGGAGTAAGKVVSRRAATADEEKIISGGGWLRVNRDGKKPGQSGYMQRKSKVRPQNNAAEGMELSMDEDERGNAVVVVALPAEDDPIWAASSEKVPHLTILFFGKNVAAGDIGWLKGVVKEAADKMTPFTATVTSREPLGDDGADVVMVDPGQQLIDARSQMLSDHTVEVMFNAVDQYPSFTPHVTLGYPDTPANGEPSDTIRFDRLSVWDGEYEGEEYPMGSGMTASSHWTPFALTASAGVCAPLEDLHRDKVRVLLPLSDRDASSLVVENIVGRDLSVPVLELGTLDDITTSQQERLQGILEGLALSRNESLSADLGMEYGSTSGVLWNRPHIDGFNALRARLIAEFAQNSIPFSRALPSPVLELACIGDAPVPAHLADATPQRVYFDRIALQVGEDVYEYPFGVLGSAAPMAASGLIVDGDAISEFSEITAPPEVTHNANSGKGSRFRIPLLVPEGVPTGDGRKFKPLSLTTRDLPLPLMWQIKTSDGHDGSVVVGRIDTVERIDAGLGNALGVFDTGPYGREAERMVREKMLRGVSADLDQFEAVAEEPQGEMSDGEDDSQDISKAIKAAEILVSKARVMGVTIVAKPAFQECSIELIADDDIEQEEPLVADGIYMDRLTASDAEALTACAMVASHIPVEPPASWFANPMLREPTPITVTDEGQVFGHIAAWHVDHIGLPFGTRPPRSRSNYAYFHTGVCRTAEKKDIPVGQLTLAGGHAGLDLSASEAVKHYDDTASAVADVHAGEDAYGIWVAGGVRPGTTPEQIRALRASAPSGDWRPVQGRLELVAVCQVNVPGFPIARARVASGYVTALVAAGASALAELRGPTVDDRIAALAVEMRRERVAEDAALLATRFHRTAEMATGVTNFRAYSKETLEEYAKKGWAHKNKDGHVSYPIADVADLRRAIRAYGRASKEDKPAIRKHIMRRARGLDRPDLIPEQWMKSAAISTKMELAKTAPDMELVADGVFAMTASLRYRRPIDFKEESHPRDEHGKFRKVLFRLQDDLKGKTGTKKALDEAEAALESEGKGDDKGAKEAADRLLVELDKIADNTADLQDKEDLQRNGAALAEVIARLPMPQGNKDLKMRFTDLPMELRDLVEDLLDRLAGAVNQEKFNEVAGPVKNYISGADYMTSDEIQAHLARILRFLI